MTEWGGCKMIHKNETKKRKNLNLIQLQDAVRAKQMSKTNKKNRLHQQTDYTV